MLAARAPPDVSLVELEEVSSGKLEIQKSAPKCIANGARRQVAINSPAAEIPRFSWRCGALAHCVMA
jgi:hypothetical protein